MAQPSATPASRQPFGPAGAPAQPAAPVEGPAPDSAPVSGSHSQPPSWLETVQSVVADLPGLIGDRVELLSLELQRAGRALAQMVALIVAAAILGVTAWLALWGVAVGVMVALGWPWYAGLGVVLLLNLVAGWLAVRRVRVLARLLGLPATRRNLSFSPPKVSGPSAAGTNPAAAPA